VSATRRWLIGVLLLASAAPGLSAVIGPAPGIPMVTASRAAEVDLTVHPAMVKGASTAPVTIVEFSDYQ
jgi:hypothetical protein